ncbi:MAG: hypothetical protein EOM24_06440 [Chloroflexia bacterium]|nr:hypothetical protein [Chloroflexia bacterium]
MSTSPSIETPTEALARKIVERLVQERLITSAAAAKLQPKLAAGKLSAEDWRLPIELGMDREVES